MSQYASCLRGGGPDLGGLMLLYFLFLCPQSIFKKLKPESDTGTFDSTAFMPSSLRRGRS